MPSTGTPASNTACGAAGGRLSVTDSGPPERIIPRAPKAAYFVAIHVPRQDLAVDAALAYPAGDELRVLRPEVEYQDPVGVDIRRPQRQCGPALN